MMIFITWLCIPFLAVESFKVISIDILKDFFEKKDIKDGILITCLSTADTVNVYKQVTENGLQINIFNPSQINLLGSTIHINKYDKIGIVLDLSCEDSNEFLRDVPTLHEKNSIYSYNYHWLILDYKIDNETLQTLSNLDMNIDAEIWLAISQVTRIEYDVYEVYNTGKYHSGNLILNLFGKWQKHGGFPLLKLYKYVRRSNMTGVVLRCMTVVTKKLINETFIDYLSKPVQTHIDSMNRFNYALLLHLRDIYNFSYDMSRTNSWGYSHNGTFDGMVGQLEKGLVDIGGSPIFFRIERQRVVDHTIQTWVSRPCFILRNPAQNKAVFKVYTSPFEDRIWYLAIALMSGVTFCFFLLTKLQNRMIKTSEDSTWSFAIMYTLGAVFQQGVQSNLILLSGKILTLAIFVFAILFYQYYSASIVSSLLMEPVKSIRTLEDLLQSDLKVGIENILYTLDYFHKTNDPTALKLFKTKIAKGKKDNFFQPIKGLAMVKRGGFAFHVDIATAYKIIRETFTEKEICELTEIQLFPPQRMVAIVQKRSPFRKLVTYGLRKISVSGLMDHQKRIWHEPKPRCVKGIESAKVTIKQFSSALEILAIGMMTSILILLLEIRFNKKESQAKHKINNLTSVKRH